MERSLRRTAVVLLVVGAMAMALPQLAFSSVDATRSSTIGVVDDPNAYLGVENKNGGFQLKGSDPPQRVATLRNNLDETVGVDDVVVDSISAGSDDVLRVADHPTSLAPGTAGDVTVECNRAQNLGTSTVTFRVTEASGPTTTITGVTFSVQIDIKCKAGGGTVPPNFEAGNVTQSGVQNVSFNVDSLKNKDQAVIDLSDAQGSGLDYSGASVQVVSGPAPRSLTFDQGNARITYETSGNPTGRVTLQITGIAVDGNSGDSFTGQYSDDLGRTETDGFRIE